MAKQKKPRGLFERPTGSGVWWINYYIDGRQHREKVGTITNAKKLYAKRKEDYRAGRKLPTLRNTAIVTVSSLIDLMLTHIKTQHHKDQRTYESRGEVVRNTLGDTTQKTSPHSSLRNGWASTAKHLPHSTDIRRSSACRTNSA